MPPRTNSIALEPLPSRVRVHVIGTGPVGSSAHGQLAPYLVADSVDSYRTDYIDGDHVDAVFDPAELHEGLAFRRSISPDLMALLRAWTVGFCPLNSIERA